MTSWWSLPFKITCYHIAGGHTEVPCLQPYHGSQHKGGQQQQHGGCTVVDHCEHDEHNDSVGQTKAKTESRCVATPEAHTRIFLRPQRRFNKQVISGRLGPSATSTTAGATNPIVAVAAAVVF